MRLTSALVERALSQFEAQALPDNHPMVPHLNRLYGDHTYFVDASGLSIVEFAGVAQDGVEVGRIVNLASWDDADDPPSLDPHEPQPTNIVVILGSKH